MPRIERRAIPDPLSGCAVLMMPFLVNLLFLTGLPAAEPPRQELLSRWKYFQEIQLPPARTARLYDFVLPVEVFDGARTDLGDPRLYDSAGKEVPYALRIRRPDLRTEVIPARAFNRSKDAEGASEVTLDLGERPGEHNDVEVQMPGVNYRRHARLEGADDGKDWHTL